MIHNHLTTIIHLYYSAFWSWKETEEINSFIREGRLAT